MWARRRVKMFGGGATISPGAAEPLKCVAGVTTIGKLLGLGHPPFPWACIVSISGIMLRQSR